MDTRSWRYLSIGLVLLFACGQGAEPGVSVLGDALSAAEAAESARLEMTMSMDMGAFGSVDMRMEGVAAIDGAAADFTMTMDAMGTSLDGAMLVVGDEAFVSRELAEMAWQLTPPATANWVRLDATALAAGMANPQGGVGMDPSQMLDMLRAAGDVEEAGQEDVRGTATTRYDAVVGVAALMGEADMSIEEMMRAQQEAMPQAGELPEGMIDQMADAMRDLEYEMSVWIADDSLPRRVESTVDLAPMFAALTGGDADQALVMEMRLDYLEFGVPVDVERPPSAEIWDPNAV